MGQFVHLHLHTEYSLLDGATRIGKIFSACDEMNMPAVAITDHGNMYGALEFCKAAVRFTDPSADFYEFMSERRPFRIKPIIGCELYMTPDMKVKTTENGKMPKYNHLILLAKNLTGYKNLIKLVSLSYTEGLYYKPRIDMALLREHCEGLVCMSACIAGIVPQTILKGDLAGADRLVKEFKSLFGEDYYIEIQDHNIADQKKVLPHLIKLAHDNGVKLIASNDCHYLKKSDASMQKVLQCISFRTTMPFDEENSGEIKSIASGEIQDDGYFPTKEFYMKSYDEMLEVFPNLPEALANTLEIADKCECYFFAKEPLMPSYIPEDGSDPYDFLCKLCYEGLERKYKEITPEIRERAEYELGIVHRLGFVDYYLIVWDFIHWSETHDVPVGPGRGSGVGSIVAYAIGITKVDPLKYQLIFERFLNCERVSNPDFDIDFCVDKREEVIKYVTRKYGAANVSQIVTFGTLAAKAAVKDVGRVYNQPYAEVEKITKLIPALMGKKHIEHLLGLKAWKDNEVAVVPELVEMYNNDYMAKAIIDMAMKIEGMPRQTGMHAAGVIICRDPIADHLPMAKTSDGNITTQFNMIECEELGLLKMDFLGLRTLTDIKKAIDIIKVTRGVTLDFYNMDYDDEGVFKLIGDGNTHAVFQLEGDGMRKFMRDLRPTSLEDIIAGISLYRPGPMDKIGEYCNNKRHPESIKYDHPLCKPILEVSYGVMVYQEQVMQMVQKLGGYSLGRADNVRRMMSKKKKDAMEKEREVFVHGTIDSHGVVVAGCVKNGVPEQVANKIYDDMISFASYAFNKSHAAAYAYVAYQTAYLKCYYTVEYITAVLNNRINSIDEIRNYLTYLKDNGIGVYTPSINKSFADFTVEDGAVRIGMAAIKNVGRAVIDDIVLERNKNGDFADFVQFVRRMQDASLNKRMLESLIYAGAFDEFGKTRSQLIAVYESVMDRVSKDKQAKLKGQFSFFDNLPDSSELDKFDYPDLKEYNLGMKLAKEKEVAGVYLTGHPLDEYADHLKTFSYNSASFIRKEDDEGEANADEDDFAVADDTSVTVGGMLIEADRRVTKAGKDLGIGKIEDLYGTIDVMASGYKLNAIKDSWAKDKLVTISGKVKNRDGKVTIWVDGMSEWSNNIETTAPPKKVCVYFSFENSEPKLLDKIQEIMLVYPGRDLTYVKNTDDNQIYPLDIGVRINDLMLNELYGLLGDGNVRVAK